MQISLCGTGVCQWPAPGTKWLQSVMFERNKNAYKREIQKIYLQRAKGDKPTTRAWRVCCCADTERRVNSWINSIWAQRTLPIRSPAFGNPTLTPSGGLFLGPDESFAFVIVINYSIITVQMNDFAKWRTAVVWQTSVPLTRTCMRGGWCRWQMQLPVIKKSSVTTHVKRNNWKECVKEFMRVGRNGLDQTRTTSGITAMLLFCTPLN